MPKKQRDSTLAIALEMLALASSLLDNCAALEEGAAKRWTVTSGILHIAADDIQEVIGNVKQRSYVHEANQL